MAEYIERDAVLNRLKDNMRAAQHGSVCYDCTMSAIETVEAAPAADVVEVRHGRWELVYDETGNEAFGFKEITVSGHRCSICLKSVDVSEGYFRYCPNCGAKMDGKEGA